MGSVHFIATMLWVNGVRCQATGRRCQATGRLGYDASTRYSVRITGTFVVDYSSNFPTVIFFYNSSKLFHKEKEPLCHMTRHKGGCRCHLHPIVYILRRTCVHTILAQVLCTSTVLSTALALVPEDRESAHTGFH